MLENPEGIYGIRCLTYWTKTFFSPVYGQFVWSGQGWKTAECYMGDDVPCDKHGDVGGCGFHGVWEFNSALDFVRAVAGHCTVMVLAEYAGKIITHERGLRGQYCRVRGILNWNVNNELSSWLQGSIYHAPDNLLAIATDYFSAPLVESSEANNLIRASKNKLVVGKSGFQLLQ